MKNPATDGKTVRPAVDSLVWGILGFPTLGLTGIWAVILGHLALSKIKKFPDSVRGKRMAIGGLVWGYVSMASGLAVTVLLLMPRSYGHPKIEQPPADFKMIESSLMSYQLLAGEYPTPEQGLRALVSRPEDLPVGKKWGRVMSKVPLDPWRNEYLYRFPGRKNPKEPEIYSKGPDGILDTTDDMSSQDEE